MFIYTRYKHRLNHRLNRYRIRLFAISGLVGTELCVNILCVQYVSDEKAFIDGRKVGAFESDNRYKL